jgi:DnaJ-class molecular chaperone
MSEIYMTDKICNACNGEGVIYRDTGKLSDNNTIGVTKIKVRVCPKCKGHGYICEVEK